MSLRDWRYLRYTIGGGCRRKHDGLHAAFHKRRKKRQARGHVIIEIFDWILRAFTNQAKDRKVNTSLDPVVFDHLRNSMRVADIGLDQRPPFDRRLIPGLQAIERNEQKTRLR